LTASTISFSSTAREDRDGERVDDDRVDELDEQVQHDDVDQQAANAALLAVYRSLGAHDATPTDRTAVSKGGAPLR
jgi:hypothetical protein